MDGRCSSLRSNPGRNLSLLKAWQASLCTGAALIVLCSGRGLEPTPVRSSQVLSTSDQPAVPAPVDTNVSEVSLQLLDGTVVECFTVDSMLNLNKSKKRVESKKKLK